MDTYSWIFVSERLEMRFGEVRMALIQRLSLCKNQDLIKRQKRFGTRLMNAHNHNASMTGKCL